MLCNLYRDGNDAMGRHADDEPEVGPSRDDIRIAIHNHGIRSLYGNPLVVRTLLKHRDPRMGVCMDAGWITSTGMDPTKVFKDYPEPYRYAGVTMCSVFLIGLMVLPFAPETKGKPLPE